MRTWPLDNFTIYGIQKLLTDLRHISWFVTVAFRNVPICAKFMEAQWNNTLKSCHEAGCSAYGVHTGAQQCNVWIKRVATVFLINPLRKKTRSRKEKNIFFNSILKKNCVGWLHVCAQITLLLLTPGIAHICSCWNRCIIRLSSSKCHSELIAAVSLQLFPGQCHAEMTHFQDITCYIFKKTLLTYSEHTNKKV